MQKSKSARTQLYASAGKMDITPGYDLELRGFGERKSSGVHDPLYVRCLLLESGGETVVILTCDLVGILLKTTDRIRTLIAEKVPVKPGNIMISCTHCHSAPSLVSCRGCVRIDQKWKRAFLRKTVRLVVDVFNKRQPATIAAGTGSVRGVAANREARLSDGSLFHYMGNRRNPPKGKRVVKKGVIDPEMAVIGIRDTGGRPIAALINYACHPWLYKGSKISSEISGACVEYVESELAKRGEDTVVLYTDGAGSNLTTLQNHKPIPNGVRKQERWYTEERSRFGRILGKKALEVIRGIRRYRADVSIKSRLRGIRVPMYRQSLGTILQKTGCLPKPNLFRDSEVQAITLGDIVIVGLPSEVYVEFGLEIKRRSKYKHTIVVSQSNDYFSDFITHQAVKDGCCPELKWTRVGPGGGDVFMKALAPIFAGK